MGFLFSQGVKALKELKGFTQYGMEGPKEMVFGTMTGDGHATLMTQAAMYGRTACVDFLLDHGSRATLTLKSATHLNASEYAKYREADVYDPKFPNRLPTRPHNKIYHKLRLEMGEYVEKDNAADTPGVSNWKGIERHWPYRVPVQWQPDRPYHVLRDRAHARKYRPTI